MSDFDRFFAEKLDEEGDFPRRDRNWKQLSQRLDAFDAGGQIRPSRWHYWPAAAAVVVSLTVAGWMTWKMNGLQQENRALKEEIAMLRQPGTSHSPAATFPEEEEEGKAEVDPEKKHSSALAPVPDHSISTAAEKQTEKRTVEKLQEKEPVTRHSNPTSNKTFVPSSQNKNTLPANPTAPIASDNKTYTAPSNNANKNQPVDPSTAEGKKQDLKPGSTTEPANQPPTIATSANNDQRVDTSSALAGKQYIKAVLPDETGISPIKSPDSLQTQPVAVTSQDSTKVVATDEKKPDVVSSSSASPDSLTTATVPIPLIKPARHSARFRLGVEALGGVPLPKQTGISLLTGTGVIASYSPVHFLRVFASADWLHFDVNADHFMPKFHAPHEQPPMHQGPHDQLVQVESSQRQQYYSLGLTYVPPVHGWLRPAVRIAHSWVHVNSCLVSFRFEEQHGPGPGPSPNPHDSDYVAKKFGGQTINNVWRVGAGVEHELAHWTFGLWADYSKDFASTESTFDALMLRAGVQYKFN